jgi:hypothetical protein
MSETEVNDNRLAYFIVGAEPHEPELYATVDLGASPTTLGFSGGRTARFFLDAPGHPVVDISDYMVAETGLDSAHLLSDEPGISESDVIAAALNNSPRRIMSSAALPPFPFFACGSPRNSAASWRVELELLSDSLCDTPDFERTLRRLDSMYRTMRSSYTPTLSEMYAVKARNMTLAPGMHMPCGAMVEDRGIPGVFICRNRLAPRQYCGELHLLDQPDSISHGDVLARVFTNADLEPVQLGRILKPFNPD